MWVFTSRGMVSVVQVRGQPGKLLVRARRAGEIEALMPRAKVHRSPGADYLWRAVVSRRAFARALQRAALAVSYPNFKNSVLDDNRHDFYMDVWQAALAYQRRHENVPQAGKARPRRVLLPGDEA